MSKLFDRPITIQILDENTEDWSDLFDRPIHARINKASSDNEHLTAGAIRSKRTLTFEVRYFKALEAISLNTQIYRIIYQGVPYNIVDYDDFMLKHNTVKLLGVSY
jgi:SPP1 family predicted phage head-tail adaptor